MSQKITVNAKKVFNGFIITTSAHPNEVLVSNDLEKEKDQFNDLFQDAIKSLKKDDEVTIEVTVEINKTKEIDVSKINVDNFPF